MSDIVGTFRSYALDKDNCPRMGSEVIPVRVSLLLEAAAEITRLRAALDAIREATDMGLATSMQGAPYLITNVHTLARAALGEKP